MYESLFGYVKIFFTFASVYFKKMETVKIFIAYTGEDESVKKDLRVYLKPLSTNNFAEIWDKMDLLGGEVIDEVVNEKFMRAEVILLLISPEALASEDFNREYIDKAIEHHEKKEKIIIPIKLKPSQIGVTQLAKISSLPRNGTVISTVEYYQDQLNEIVEDIKHVIMRINSQKKYNKFVAYLESANLSFESQNWDKAYNDYQNALNIRESNFTPTEQDLLKLLKLCDKEKKIQNEKVKFEMDKKELDKIINKIYVLLNENDWARVETEYTIIKQKYSTTFPKELNNLFLIIQEKKINKKSDKKPIWTDWKKDLILPLKKTLFPYRYYYVSSLVFIILICILIGLGNFIKHCNLNTVPPKEPIGPVVPLTNDPNLQHEPLDSTCEKYFETVEKNLKKWCKDRKFRDIEMEINSAIDTCPKDSLRYEQLRKRYSKKINQ
jgi:tetratricopeptide (TPR) repeat protein